MVANFIKWGALDKQPDERLLLGTRPDDTYVAA